MRFWVDMSVCINENPGMTALEPTNKRTGLKWVLHYNKLARRGDAKKPNGDAFVERRCTSSPKLSGSWRRCQERQCCGTIRKRIDWSSNNFPNLGLKQLGNVTLWSLWRHSTPSADCCPGAEHPRKSFLTSYYSQQLLPIGFPRFRIHYIFTGKVRSSTNVHTYSIYSTCEIRYPTHDARIVFLVGGMGHSKVDSGETLLGLPRLSQEKHFLDFQVNAAHPATPGWVGGCFKNLCPTSEHKLQHQSMS